MIRDIYVEDDREELLEEEAISLEEDGFIRGYMELS